MSAFDPFGDYDEKGYLRNHAGVKDKALVSRLEHVSFSRNIERALKTLEASQSITHEEIKETHRILFSDVYPWAGKDRSQNAANLHITKGDVEFQLAPYVPHGVDHALKGAADFKSFRENPGKLIGELAYAHPFLEGNGRVITAVASELSRRAGFHIAWEKTSKQDYLTALTKELDDPKAGHLTRYLQPFIQDSALGIGEASQTLTTLPGLSAPEQNLECIQESKPRLTILAGPDGAGKASLAASGLSRELPVIDSEAIAKALNPDNPRAAASIAGKRALDLQSEYLDKGQSFITKTTLSGNSALNLIEQAKQRGFSVDLKFVGLENVDLAISRMAARAASDGSEVDQREIVKNFDNAFKNLPEAISKADHAELYDNSGKAAFRLVATLERDQFQFKDASSWATDAAFDAAQNDLSKAETVQELERATARALDSARGAGVTESQLSQEMKKLAQEQKRQKSREGHDL